MDVNKTLRELYEEKRRLDRLIARLEATSVPSRPGRKSMSAAEREAVSLRMKEYWAKKRANGASGEEPAPSPSAESATTA